MSKNAELRGRHHNRYPRAKLGRAIRDERYRLVEWHRAGDPAEAAELELYDYETDPLDIRNVAAQQPQVVARLRAILATYPEPVDTRRTP